MGLPIFREPSEKEATSQARDKKSHPDAWGAALARSAIRRTRHAQHRRPILTRSSGTPEDTTGDAGERQNDQIRRHNAQYLREADLRRPPARQQTRSPSALPYSSIPLPPMGRNSVFDEDFQRRVNALRSGIPLVTASADSPGDSSAGEEPSAPSIHINDRPQSRRGPLWWYSSLPSDLIDRTDSTDRDSARPLLRRVGNRSINSAASRLASPPARPVISESTSHFRSILDPLNDSAAANGLGDRNRSVSPAASDEANQWDSFTSNILPDPNLPSASTSFASNNAAADDSFSSTYSSFAALTSGGLGEPGTAGSSRSLRLPPPRRPNMPAEDLTANPWAMSGPNRVQSTDGVISINLGAPSYRTHDIPIDCPVHHYHNRTPFRPAHFHMPPSFSREVHNLHDRHRRFVTNLDPNDFSNDATRLELQDMWYTLDRMLARGDLRDLGELGDIDWEQVLGRHLGNMVQELERALCCYAPVRRRARQARSEELHEELEDFYRRYADAAP